MKVLSADEAFRRAYLCYRSGRLTEAEGLCRAILQAEPGHADAAYFLALLAAAGGRAEETERMLERAVERRAFSITLDYPVPQAPRYRERPHPLLQARLERGRDEYEGLLRAFAGFVPRLGTIAASGAKQGEPHWDNPWMPPLDAIALYGLIALRRPRRYVEIGSGMSTRFARRAIREHGLATEIVSVDPEPRAEVDALCEVAIRAPLEQADLGVFRELGAGDLVFLDGSHRCFMGSDATVFFTEVLPALAPGVTVGVHDIFLPFDYPPEWAPRYYSEQYLLACYLLAPRAPFRVLLPMRFALADPRCARAAQALLEALPAARAAGAEAASFWLETGEG